MRRQTLDGETVFRTFRLALIAACVIYIFPSLHTLSVLDSNPTAFETNPIAKAVIGIHPLLPLCLPLPCLSLCWLVFRWDKLAGLMAAGGILGVAMSNLLFHVFWLANS